MKSAEFIDTMADLFSVPKKTMVTYTRFLKEAGLLTTGARGVNAPHMTPMDAARVTIALLACDTPGQAVERVKRFGSIPYSPNFQKSWPWYENIGQERFNSTFGGETFEEVLEFMYGRSGALGLDGASHWFQNNDYHVRINDFNVLAELVSWKTEDGKPVGEIVAPFRGDPRDPDQDFITGSIRTTREATSLKFIAVGVLLYNHAGPGGRYSGCDINGKPLDPEHPWNRDLPPHERGKRRSEIEEYLAAREAKEGGK